ncbi:MAG: amino acid permease [Saprospiraceae bacterium]|nr:amino acid permease [Saprospiraceae bacterium]
MSNQFKQQISLYTLTMIAIGSSIGAGIFKTPSEIARYLPAEGWVFTVWIVGGFISLCGALTFAEIASYHPKAGGFYVFLKEAFGELPAFLYGWTMLVVVNTGSLAALSLVFASYLSYLIPMSDALQVIVAVSAIVLLTIMNVLGVRLGGLFASIFTTAKLLGIFIVVAIGVLWGKNDVAFTQLTWTGNAQNLSLISAFGLALIGTNFSYGGYQHATFVAAEVKNAQRIVPRALLLGISVVCLAYLTVNWAYLKLLPMAQMSASNSVASDAVSVVWSVGATFIAFLIVLSVLGTIGIYILTAPRIYFAMADDGLFFKQFAALHPKYKTPQYAIIFQSVWTILLLLFWKTFSDLITYVVFIDTAFFGLTAATLFIFKKQLKENIGGVYKTIGYPITPLIFIAMSAFIVINTLIEKPVQAVAGLLFLGVGVGVFYYFKEVIKN